VPQSFAVKFDRSTITFGSIAADVALWNVDNTMIGVFARPNGWNLQVVFDVTTGKGTWTLDGIPGNASGTIAVRQ